MSANNKPEFEIIGLHHCTEGRSCTIHPVCGLEVNNNDVLRLVPFVAQIWGSAPEEAIKLVKIVDGTETCTVGFVPRPFAKMNRIRSRVGSFCQVLEVYDRSENKYKQRLSEKTFA
jgi:hypothetical protein